MPQRPHVGAWEEGERLRLSRSFAVSPKPATSSKQGVFYNLHTQPCTNFMKVSSHINPSIKIIGKSVYGRIYCRLYRKGSCHAFHMSLQICIYVQFLFQKNIFWKEHILFALDLASLKVSLAFSYSDGVSRI